MPNRHNTVRRLLQPLLALRQTYLYTKQNRGGMTLPGRHIVVVESDDWGSIRVLSREV